MRVALICFGEQQEAWFVHESNERLHHLAGHETQEKTLIHMRWSVGYVSLDIRPSQVCMSVCTCPCVCPSTRPMCVLVCAPVCVRVRVCTRVSFYVPVCISGVSMSVPVYVHILVHMCLCAHLCAWAFICICVSSVFAYVHMYVLLYMCVHTVFPCMECAPMCTCLCVCAFVCVCVYITCVWCRQKNIGWEGEVTVERYTQSPEGKGFYTSFYTACRYWQVSNQKMLRIDFLIAHIGCSNEPRTGQEHFYWGMGLL